jgi:hypothetical protein
MLFCLFACICGKNSHEKFEDSEPIYSANQLVMIGGKEWRFICRTSINIKDIYI